MLLKQLKMKNSEKKCMLGMLAATLGATLLWNMFSRKSVLIAGKGTKWIQINWNS